MSAWPADSTLRRIVGTYMPDGYVLRCEYTDPGVPGGLAVVTLTGRHAIVLCLELRARYGAFFQPRDRPHSEPAEDS